MDPEGGEEMLAENECVWCRDTAMLNVGGGGLEQERAVSEVASQTHMAAHDVHCVGYRRCFPDTTIFGGGCSDGEP